MAFTETFLNDTYDSKELNIIGYQLLRKDRLFKGGGGILVYIKQSLCVFLRDEIKVDGVESLWFELCLKCSENIIVGVVYRPPPLDSIWLEAFERELINCCDFSKKIIITGDFNVNNV